MSRYIEIKPNYERNRLEIDFYGNYFAYEFDRRMWTNRNHDKIEQLPYIVYKALGYILDRRWFSDNLFLSCLSKVYSKYYPKEEFRMHYVAIVFWTCKYNNDNLALVLNNLLDYFNTTDYEKVEDFYTYCYSHNCGYERFYSYTSSVYNNLIDSYYNWGLKRLSNQIGLQNTYKFIEMVQKLYYNKDTQYEIFRNSDKLYDFFKGLN